MKSRRRLSKSVAERQKINRPPEVFALLHNIRSVQNVASIFRTADCLGVSEVLLVGYTPPPLDRFGRPRKDFAKVSLGAERAVVWRQFKNFSRARAFLKKRRAYVVAVEQSPQSVDYRKVKPRYPLALVFGGEVEGLPPKALSDCDIIAEIPMRGVKESLNVSAAAAIALSRILK